MIPFHDCPLISTELDWQFSPAGPGLSEEKSAEEAHWALLDHLHRAHQGGGAGQQRPRQRQEHAESGRALEPYSEDPD